MIHSRWRPRLSAFRGQPYSLPPPASGFQLLCPSRPPALVSSNDAPSQLSGSPLLPPLSPASPILHTRFSHLRPTGQRINRSTRSLRSDRPSLRASEPLIYPPPCPLVTLPACPLAQAHVPMPPCQHAPSVASGHGTKKPATCVTGRWVPVARFQKGKPIRPSFRSSWASCRPSSSLPSSLRRQRPRQQRRPSTSRACRR